jgi:MFS family permease
VAWTVTGLLVSGAGKRWSRRFIILGNVSIVVACALMITVMAAGNLAWVLLAGGLLGSGFGLSYSFISTAVMVTLDESDRASGSAAIGAMRNAGGATGGAIASVAANIKGFSDQLPHALLGQASTWIFLTSLPLAVIGLYAAIRLVRLLPRGN